MFRFFCILGTVLGLAWASSPTLGQEKTAAEKVAFDRDVKPVLKKHCAGCHNLERPRGDLDLTSFAGIMTGGMSGKAAVAGKPEDSPLYTLAAHLDEPKMPPGKPKIPQRDLDLIRNWIVGGLIEKAAAVATNSVVSPPPVGGLGPADPFPRLSPVTALAVHPTAPLAAVAGRRQVLLFDIAASKLLGGVPFPEGEVHVLRFARDGSVLLAGGGVGGQSGAVVGFDTKSWQRTFELTDETDVVLASDLSIDKRTVVLGGPGRVVKVFSVPDGKPLHTFRKPIDWVLAAGFSPDGLLVAAGDRFGGLFVWEAKSGKEFYTLRGHTKGLTGIAWRADGDVLASCSEDGSVRLWDLHTGTESAQWEAHPGGVLAIDVHPAGVVATSGRDGRVKAWREAGKSVADLGPTTDIALKVAVSTDGRAAVSGDWAGEVRVWPLDGKPAAKLPLPIKPTTTVAAAIPVPIPTPGAAAKAPAATLPRPSAGVQPNPPTSDELTRKRAALKAVEEAAERLKEEAARNPKNPALAKAYLQVCEAVLALKTEVLEAEAAAKIPPTSPEKK